MYWKLNLEWIGMANVVQVYTPKKSSIFQIYWPIYLPKIELFSILVLKHTLESRFFWYLDIFRIQVIVLPVFKRYTKFRYSKLFGIKKQYIQNYEIEERE